MRPSPTETIWTKNANQKLIQTDLCIETKQKQKWSKNLGNVSVKQTKFKSNIGTSDHDCFLELKYDWASE